MRLRATRLSSIGNGTRPRSRELIVNGDFSSATGWAFILAGWSITGGKAVLSSTSGNNILQQQFQMPIGATAVFSFDIDAISNMGALAYVRIGTLATGVGTVDLLPAFGARPLGRNTVTFTNTLGQTAIYLKFATDSAARTATIDNVSIIL